LRLRITKPHAFLENHFHFHPELENVIPPCALSGNFQSFKYFNWAWNSIASEFNFTKSIEGVSQEMAEMIQSSNSVCINVRRGDYIWHPEYKKILGFRGLEYLLPAVEELKSRMDNPHFFIFSDDVEWCQQTLLPKIGGTLVDHSHKGWKFGNYLQLMTLCKHHIIPNSTFGWWAAWLGRKPGQVVIAPKIWYQDASFDTKDLCPPEWLKL
jgi:hypothetical protein